MLEKGLENYMRQKIQSMGGAAWKWVCPSRKGVPDRICIFPGGRVVFIELKRPGRKDGLDASQKKVFKLLTALGCDIRRIGSKEEVDHMLKEVMRNEV